MTVREVIALSASLLGREDLKEQALSGKAEGELEALVRCFHLVENEIALDYFPLKRTEEVAVRDGRIYYSALSSAPVNVHRITSGGRVISFTLLPEYAELKGQAARAEVLYSYIPSEKGIDGVSDFSGRISARLMAFGVCAEFCLARGRYDEAEMWEKRYREALRAANILRRRLCVRPRRWA